MKPTDTTPQDPFQPYNTKPETIEGVFSAEEVQLANRNHGLLLETLACDITPTGAHYLLNHFDVPLLNEKDFQLTFNGAFDAPYKLSMADIRALDKVTMPVTLECAGNGRAGMSPRSYSMPWMHEAAGTSLWTGTALWPLIAHAIPSQETIEIAFYGADYGYDMGHGHHFGRSLTVADLQALDVLLVYEMNGAPLLPQHGAPLRIIVPGWYGMASVKWLIKIEALTKPYDGFQQVRTYQFREKRDDPGVPIQDMRVKSLMRPPGVPDWISRKRCLQAGPVTLMGRAWSGLGRSITRVEVNIGEHWHEAKLTPGKGKFAWTRWELDWHAQPGDYVLRCRATDSAGNIQPLTPPWDVAGFANNAVHCLNVIVV